MSGTADRVASQSGWGIEPVPDRLRALSTLDLAILWGDLGIGLLVLVTGGLLVPGLGFGAALAAIAIGSLLGVALLSVGAVAGARYGVPTMVLFRPVLGIRGSWLPSAFNVAQMIGWTAVELWAMSFVADLVGRRVFGFSARWLWLAIVAVTCTGLALWGPVGVTRVWLKRFGAWVVLGICVVLTILALTTQGIGDALGARGAGGFPTFGQALDLVIAMPVSWLPLVADYTRFARRSSAAGWGTFVGYLIANVWLYALGALLILGAGGSPDPGGIALGILALAGGSVAGIIFLVGLLAGETDEAFADVYSGAMSLRNVWPRASHAGLTIGIGVVSAALAAMLTMELYESFLFLIGSVFVPLFGVLAADLFINRRGGMDADALSERDGPYWFTSGVRAAAFAPWLVGFALYHWIAPTGPAWWTDTVSSVFGSPLGDRVPWLGASIPSFIVSFLLGLALPALSSETTAERRER